MWQSDSCRQNVLRPFEGLSDLDFRTAGPTPQHTVAWPAHMVLCYVYMRAQCALRYLLQRLLPNAHIVLMQRRVASIYATQVFMGLHSVLYSQPS